MELLEYIWVGQRWENGRFGGCMNNYEQWYDQLLGGEDEDDEEENSKVVLFPRSCSRTTFANKSCSGSRFKNF